MEDNTPPDTSNFLDWVEIKNFKSIKDLRLDCKRVNIFIGKPNVGKSNILEALGLLGEGVYDKKIYNGSVRYSQFNELFPDSNIKIPIIIQSNVGHLSIRLLPYSGFEVENKYELNIASGTKNLENKAIINENGEIINAKIVHSEGEARPLQVSVKKYDFASLIMFNNVFSDHLLAPNGPNLFAVVDSLKSLKIEFSKLFREQQLDFVLSRAEQSFILQKKEGMYVSQYSFLSIADTFRRFMFYIAAIESNKNSVLIFEEPEVHSFPPYIHELAQRMILVDENQYFVSTHSPYLLHTFIEQVANDDLNVFITYYENYETKVRALTPDELRHILDFGTDVFFNLDKFTPNAGHSIPV